MSLEELCHRLRAERIERGAHGQASITVKRGDSPDRRRQFTGTVRVDNQQIGYLVGTEPRSFDVEPGDHTVTVHLGRRDRVPGARGKAVVSALVSVGPGEHVVLTCGVRPELAQKWAESTMTEARRGVLFAIVVYIFASLGWLLSPVLRQGVVAVVSYYFPATVAWLPLLLWLVSPLASGFYAAVAAGLLIGLWVQRNRKQTGGDLLSESGAPYYLQQQPGIERQEPAKIVEGPGRPQRRFERR
jgi:hypothetical protein